MSRGMHATGHELVIGWLTTGCREGDVRGLGIPGDVCGVERLPHAVSTGQSRRSTVEVGESRWREGRQGVGFGG